MAISEIEMLHTVVTCETDEWARFTNWVACNVRLGFGTEHQYSKRHEAKKGSGLHRKKTMEYSSGACYASYISCNVGYSVVFAHGTPAEHRALFLDSAVL